MNESQEELLQKLQTEFRDSPPKKTPRKTKINHEIFIEAAGRGLPNSEAVKLAGSEAKSTASLKVAASQILSNHPEYRGVIEGKLAEKKLMILDAMSEEKAQEATLSQQAVALGIVIDKAELLAGRPTQRMASDVDLEKLKEGNYRENLMSFILGLLSGRSQLKP
jgi:hypothetical protein